MRRIVFLLLTLFSAVTFPAQDRPGNAIRGTVVQSRTLLPIPNAEVSLSPLAAFEAFETVMNSGASMSLPIQSQIPQLLSMPAEDLQTALKSINPQSMPADFLAALSRVAETKAAAPGYPKTTVSDNSGQFTFSNVPPGRYAVMVQREGFFGFEDGSNRPRSFASAATTMGASSGPDVRLSLTPGGVISGRIRDVTGVALSNLNVAALSTIYQGGLPVLQTVVSAITDDRGDYRLFWLNPGEYVVAVIPRPAAGQRGGAAPPAVTPSPSNDVPVRTYYPGVVEMASAGTVSVRIGEEIAGIDITPRSARTVKISGQIINQLGPLPPNPDGTPGATPVAALILLQRNVLIPDDAGGARQIGNIPLNPNTGTFDIPGILPGVYDLYARINHPGGSLGQAGATNAWGRTPIEVLDRDLEKLTLVIQGSVEVKGSVTVNSSAPGQVRFRVGLQPDGSSQKLPNYQGVLGRAQTPAANGAFAIPGVSVGSYRVQVLGLTEDYYLDDVRQSGGSVFDSGVFAGDRTLDPIQVSVSGNGGRLDGIVIGAGGKPAPLSTVVLIPNAPQRPNVVLYKVVTADLAGRFTIRGIHPGGYKIFAWQSVPVSAYQNAGFLSRYEAQGKALSVSPSSSSNVEIQVIPGN